MTWVNGTNVDSLFILLFMKQYNTVIAIEMYQLLRQDQDIGDRQDIGDEVFFWQKRKH